MEQHGFIQDMLDVKVLILFVMAKLSYPVSLQKIYELCYQDDKLSYFDVSVAVPQMVQSGHLEQLPDETYRITDKGREHEEITCDAIAYPVMQRAWTAVQRFNNQMQRTGLIETNVRKEESGDFIAELCLRDDAGILMRLELSLKDAAAKAQGRPIVCMLHFPPFGEKKEDSGFTQLLEAYGVHTCVYGHLHGEGIRSAFEGERGGVRYKLVSCDSLGFRLHEVEV